MKTVKILHLAKILKQIEEEKKLPFPEIEETNNDFVLGLLMGEIIWLRLLSKYTHYTLEEGMATKEEVAEQERLSEIWYKASEGKKAEGVKLAKEKKGKKLTPAEQYIAEQDAIKDNIEWYVYQDYMNALIVKYFPLTLEFSDMVCWQPKNMKEFYNGIENFLWNTDACCYVCEIEDIIFNNERGREYLQWHLNIKFKLHEIHLMPRKDYDEMLKKRSAEKKYKKGRKRR